MSVFWKLRLRLYSPLYATVNDKLTRNSLSFGSTKFLGVSVARTKSTVLNTDELAEIGTGRE